ncbi:AAA family ATPase [Persephonella sp.]
MILKRLYLKNFLAHTDTQVEFSERGITVFIGDNGAGKSSIIEGIVYGLFGRTDRGNIADLVQWGRNKAVVKLEFKKGNSEYLIERTITIRGKKASSTGIVYKKEKGQYIPYYQKNISKELPKLTGLTQKTFLTSVLVKQGDIEGLLELGPRERAKVFEEILDMTLYQLIVENAAQKRKELQSSIELLKSSIQDADELEKSLKEVQEKLSSIDGEIKKLKKDISSVDDSLNRIEKEQEFLLSEKEKNIKNISSVESARKLITSINNQIKEKEKLLTEIEEAEKKIPPLEKLIKELSELEEALKKIKQLEVIQEKIKALEEKIKTYREKERQLESNRRIATEYLQKENRLREIKKQIKEREKLKGEKDTLSRQTKQIKKQQEKLLDELGKIVGKLLGYKKSYLILKDNPLMVDQFIQNNREKIKNLMEEIEKLKEQKGKLKAYGEELNRRLKNLSGLKGKCPTCERPVDEHTRQELIEELQSELESKRDEYRQLTKKEEKLKKQLKEEEEAGKLLEKYRELFDRFSQLKNELTDINSRLTVINRKYESLSQISEEEKQLEEFLEKNREAYQLFVEAERFIKNNPVQKYQEELDRLLQEAKGLKNKLPQLEEKEIQNRIQELKKAEKEYLKLRQLIDSKEKTIGEIEKLRTEEEKLNKLIETTKQKIVEPEKIEEKLNNLKKQKSSLEEKLKALSARLTELESERGKLTGIKESIEKNLQSVRKNQERILQLGEKVERYRKIEHALGPQGIQKIIRENALYELPRITNLLFSIFGFPFQQVKFSDSFDITLLAPTVEKTDRYVPVSSLSGGQRVALGLALRLAIGRFLSNRAEFLILDEPTVHLDQQRRSDLVNILINLKEKNLVKQLILVTHDTEVEDAADSIYYVDNGMVRAVS